MPLPLCLWTIFFVIAADRPLCAAALAALSGLLAELGFEESLKKRLLPAQQQIFLGVLYDTASPGAYPVTVTVPAPKLRKAEALAADLAARTKTLRALQSAVGYFNHLSYAVWSARAFSRRLIDAVRSAHRLPLGKRSVLPVTTAMRLDLQWWQRFARSFNGQAIVLHRPRMLNGFFSTDASDVGMGGFLNGLHFSIPWVLPFAQAWAARCLSPLGTTGASAPVSPNIGPGLARPRGVISSTGSCSLCCGLTCCGASPTWRIFMPPRITTITLSCMTSTS